LDDFKVGIGIDYGEMLVLKAGIPKRHEEQSEYKNLVWVGDAANVASKLTDYAAKEYSAPIYRVTYEQITFDRVLKTSSREYPLADLYYNRPPPNSSNFSRL
jgi:class 3 adenylate cyclase